METIFAPLKTVPQIRCAAGEVIIPEGRPVAGVYFLEEGEVEVSKRGVHIATIHDAGAILGEMSWLLGTTPTATVTATVPCLLRHVADAPEFFRQHPDVTIYMATLLARRVDSLNRYLVEIKNQFQDRADHLGIIDEVLGALMNKHPRDIPRRDAGH